MSFVDRTDAGRRLAATLNAYHGQQPIVLALPRGGVPVAAEIASALHAPLDLILVRKIGVPSQPELAMGAVADGSDPTIIRNEDVIAALGISAAEFMVICDRELIELERRRRRYLGHRAQVPLTNKTAIVVDDGIATGATTRAALRAVRIRNPRRLMLAVPVAQTDALEELRDDADEIVCLEAHELFSAIGVFYRNFHQVSDEDVVAILNRFSIRAG